MKFDLANKLDVKRGLSPVAAGTDNTAMVSQVLDTQGAMGVAFLILIGANTDADATFAVLMEESDQSGSNFAAVADNDLNGTEALASFTAADDDNKVRKLGYRGSKRYVRVTITPTGNNSGNVFVAGVWVTDPENKPPANPPV